MKSILFSGALLLGSAFAAPTASFNGWVNNHCSFGIYVWTAADPSACSGGACTSPMTYLAAGGSYQVPFHPVDGAAGGVTVKFQTSDFEAAPYQGEYSLKAGKIWYNWSAVDGDPLINVRRAMQIGDGSYCANSVCEPGSTSCDWGKDSNGQDVNIFSCPAADIAMNIC